jgi:hypothetical protein
VKSFGLRVLLVLALSAGHAVAQQVFNFSLVDVNPNSARHNTAVTPRDYLLHVSGYYFGNAG